MGAACCQDGQKADLGSELLANDVGQATPDYQISAICQAQGCGKPTYDGQPGFCSKTCRAAGGSASVDKYAVPTKTKAAPAPPPAPAMCQMSGCGKPTFDGKPGFCSKTCKTASEAPAEPSVCDAPGCGKPTWDGRPGFCSKSCKMGGPVDDQGRPLCAAPGCGKPTFDGRPGFCSKKCKGPAGDLETEYQNVLTKTLAIAQNYLKEVDDDTFNQIQKQLFDKWKGGSGKPPYNVKKIYNVTNEKLVKPHLLYAKKIGMCPVKGFGASPGNMQRRFHCTRLQCAGWTGKPCGSDSCPLCNIISNGFMTKFAATGRFGPGLYSSSTPSKAYGYGDQRYLIVTSVVCGVSEYQEENTGSNTAPLDESQYNSRIITDTGGGQDECIVYHDEAMIPRYLIEFDK